MFDMVLGFIGSVAKMHHVYTIANNIEYQIEENEKQQQQHKKNRTRYRCYLNIPFSYGALSLNVNVMYKR